MSAGSQLDIAGTDGTNASRVDIAGVLVVGDSDRGAVNVSGGGRLNAATVTPTERLIIGDENPSDGSRLTVTDPGSRVDYHGTADIAVGNAGGSTSNRALPASA